MFEEDYRPGRSKGVTYEDFNPIIGKRIPNAHPHNCKHECPYGMDRAFCFPCMKKIMEEHNARKKPAVQGM